MKQQKWKYLESKITKIKTEMKKEIMCNPSEKGMFSDKTVTVTTMTKQHLDAETYRQSIIVMILEIHQITRQQVCFKRANYK